MTAKYDLKGSTVNREEKDVKSTSTQKDVNFNKHERHIYLEEPEIERFIKIVNKDSFFLNNLKIMDYSLFLIKLEKIDVDNKIEENLEELNEKSEPKLKE